MKKILFSDDSRFNFTAKVLSRNKTQTRRQCNFDFCTRNTGQELDVKEVFIKDNIWCATLEDGITSVKLPKNKQPMYKTGEVVAISQAYKDFMDHDSADDSLHNTAGWGNKLFVRAALMPHHIVIKNVRCERMLDINESDCVAEGVRKATCDDGAVVYISNDMDNSCHLSARHAYLVMCELLFKDRSFSLTNPWMWVYDFELIK